MNNIIVMFGGKSCEHDISIITALQTINALDEYLYNIIPVYIDRPGVPYTSPKYKDIDAFRSKAKGRQVQFVPAGRAIIVKGVLHSKYIPIHAAVVCMHGTNGEDGLASAILAYAGIPYTCSDMLPSSICSSKVLFKDVLHTLEVNYVPYMHISRDRYNTDRLQCIKEVITTLGLPVIIKPSTLGSSIGIEVCKVRKNLGKCIDNALQYDSDVLIEKYIDKFTEVNVAIYMSDSLQVSNIESPKHAGDILSFDDKYTAKAYTKGEVHPVSISDDKRKYIVDSAIKVYSHLHCRGVVRFDYIIADKVYLNEVNTVPGSMANYLFDKSFGQQLTEQIDRAVEDYKLDKSLIRAFDTSVLDYTNSCKLHK